MTAEERNRLEELKNDQEMLKIITAIRRIRIQMDLEDRLGMLDVIAMAQEIVFKELGSDIDEDRAILLRPWHDMSDSELYTALFIWERELRQHGAQKVGDRLFMRLVKEMV